MAFVIIRPSEGQARGRAEQLLLEVSVLSSWVTEAELSLQVLTKRMRKPNGMTTKLAATREVWSSGGGPIVWGVRECEEAGGCEDGENVGAGGVRMGEGVSVERGLRVGRTWEGVRMGIER